MRKIHVQLLIFLTVAVVAILFFRNMQNSSAPQAQQLPKANIQSSNSQNNSLDASNQGASAVEGNQGVNNSSSANSDGTSLFAAPLDRASERVTKKPFGIYITPKTSPVQPERFTGYHTGADFETFPEEANVDVAVHAVCQGKLLLKEYASGYGGVAVEACQLNGSPITVVYGHLNLASIAGRAGDILNVGDVLGDLGKGYSVQTDGERKHLHLGFHRGSAINILGYVQTKSALSGWIDPCQYVCGK